MRPSTTPNRFAFLISSLISMILLSSCSSPDSLNGETTKLDIGIVQTSVSSVAPNCKFEKFDIEESGNGKGIMSNEMDVIQYLLDGFSDFGGVLPNNDKILINYKNSGWSNSPDDNKYNWELNSVDEIYVCNTEGTSVSEYRLSSERAQSEYERYSGQNYDKCKFYKPYTEQDSRDAKACLDILKSLNYGGDWIVLATTKRISPSDFLTKFKSALKEEYDLDSGNWGRLLAASEKYLISMNGLFAYPRTDSQLVETNKLWKSLVATLGATTWDKLPEDGWGSADSSESYTEEKFLQEVIARKKEIVECTSSLRIGEVTATSGDCGKLKIEVFQSDLSSGECTFLGYWSDKDGSERIGIFRYCDAFTAGSVLEDRNYTFRVRVSGQETYTTKSGQTNRVLAFIVLGE